MELFDFAKTLKDAGWTEESITKIYHGGDHVCRCGCAGRYFKRGDRGFTRALNVLRRGFATETEGEKIWVSGYGHNEQQIADGVVAKFNFINIPEYDAPNHNRCYCLYND